MSEIDYYNKKEIDQMIETVKNNLINEIEEVVVIGESTARAPIFSNKSLSFNILKSEEK